MECINFSVELGAVLFFVALVAGFLDTLAGGGGLISMPALIVSGIPPLAALGTNKLQGCMGTATASYMMLKTKKVIWKDIKYLMLSAFLGSTLGTIAVQFINTDVLPFVIPIVLLLIAIYFLISPMPSKATTKAKLSDNKYRNWVVPFIGFYDGMFGPGTGSFFSLSGVFFRGYNLIKSTANAKLLNFSTNIASLIVFIMMGQIAWCIGFAMMAGQALGAWFGSLFLLKINPKYLRALVVFMCVGTLIKYAFSNFVR